ncbi:MAG: methyltransferase domain-containing protein [Anaerolineales bacterium]|nr:methyltransferase domain-containing protein [Anaerolineales bacterium]
MPWNPDKYHQFQTQRSAPFDDLLELVNVRPGLRVVDLGCGTGELTRRLADSLPDSDLLGLDSSPQMLEHTKEYAHPGLRFEAGNQAELEGNWDLIFSNAALQWSENHEELIPYLFSRLAPGGQIAVQVPSNHNSRTHLAILEVAGREPFVSALGGWTRQSPVLPIEAYAELLFQAEAQEIVVVEKVYPHVLENADAIVEWISGTALVPYFERLNSLKDDFVNTIRQELRLAMPGEPVFYPFRRTFFSARKAV